MGSHRSGSRKKGGDGEKSPFEYLLPPWPEWNDTDLNTEKWEGAPTSSSKNKDKSRQSSAPSKPGFENPLGHGELPNSLNASKWVRPTTLEPDVTFTVVEEDLQSCADLVTPNNHLLHSQFMRAVIASVANLLRLARRKPFNVELESPTFIPTGGNIWQPWHHVYSLCKAGKGEHHKPLVNPAGKYIVRLFFMGAWRKITVDDYLPIDRHGRLLLPATTKSNELWPMILTKALLRIASMTWTESSELVEFSITACLTGWLNIDVNTRGISNKYIWSICQKLLMADHEDSSLRYDGIVQDAVEKYKSSVSVKVSDPLCEYNTCVDHEVLGSVIICGSIADLTNFPDVVEQISPCVEHLVMITEARNINYNDDPNRPHTPLWKQFRWKEWALKKGIITYKPKVEVRSVRIFSAMRKCVMAVRPYVEFIDDIVEGVPQTTELTESEHEGKDNSTVEGKNIAVQKKVGTKRNENVGSKIKSQTEGGKSVEESAEEQKVKNDSKKVVADKSSKSSKGKSSKTPQVPLETLIESPEQLNEIEPWFDLENIIPFLNNLELYYRPSCFKYNLKISDVSQLTPTEKINTNKRGTVKEPELGTSARKCKDDCIYLLVDSMYNKKIFISLSVVSQKVEEEYARKVKELLKPALSDEQSEEIIKKDENYIYHILGEYYNWKAVSIGSEIFTLSTTGTRSFMLHLKEGIHVIRIWLKIPKKYTVHIMTQIPFTASTLDAIQELLTDHGSSLSYYSGEIMSTFTALVSAGNTEELNLSKYLEAFKNSYLPHYFTSLNLKTSNKILQDIEDRFQEAILLTLRENITNFEQLEEILVKLRMLLMKPSFGMDEIQGKNKNIAEAIKSVQESKNLFQQTMSAPSALENQSIKEDVTNFKSIKSEAKKKESKELKSQSKKETRVTASNMEQNKGLNIFLKIPEVSINILLNMFRLDQNLLKYYPFHSDLDLRLAFADYKGIQRVGNQDWLPFVRFVVNLHLSKPSLCAFNFYASIPNYTFRVINNDTLQEIPHNLLEVMPTRYSRNEKGYTLLGYGFPDQTKHREVSWKLRILAEKSEELLHSCKIFNATDCSKLQPPNLRVLELSGHYIPNRNSTICLCLLKTKKRHIVSIRLLLSNEMVPCILRIKKLSKDVSETESCGNGGLIIPVFELDVDPDSNTNKPVEFHVEATVNRRDGWPISPQEKMFIRRIKEKKCRDLLVFPNETKASSSIRVSSKKASMPNVKNTTSEIVAGAPFWILQLLVDSDNSQDITIELDRHYEDSIRKLKESWEEADPGRHERSFEIRRSFLNDFDEEDEPNVKEMNVSDNILFTPKSICEIEKLQSTRSIRRCRYFLPDEHVGILDDYVAEREEETERLHGYYARENKFFNTERELIMQDQTRRNKTFNEKYITEREISEELMENVYELRDTYISQELLLIEQEQQRLEQIKKDAKKKPANGKPQPSRAESKVVSDKQNKSKSVLNKKSTK